MSERDKPLDQQDPLKMTFEERKEWVEDKLKTASPRLLKLIADFESGVSSKKPIMITIGGNIFWY